MIMNGQIISEYLVIYMNDKKYSHVHVYFLAWFNNFSPMIKLLANLSNMILLVEPTRPRLVYGV